MRPHLFVIFTLLLLSTQIAVSDELFIRNRAFRGPTSNQGLTSYVGAEAFAEALGLELNFHDGTLYLGTAEAEGGFAGQRVRLVRANGSSVPFLLLDGKIMVALLATAEALGARVDINRDLGTTDIFAPEVAESESAEVTQEESGETEQAVAPRPQRVANPRYQPEQDKDSGLWGFVTRPGVFVIEPKFYKTREFKHGLAAACKSNGTKVVKHNKYYITGGGDYNDLSSAQQRKYDSGVSREKVRLSGGWGFVDSTGEWVIRPSLDSAGDFSEQEIDGKKVIVSLVVKGNKRWWMDRNGMKVAQAPDR